MMHLTATVQANLDCSDESDMVAKMRTAMGVTPIVSALFANSPMAEGRPSGFVSRRLHIWRDTDPDRCGLLPFVFEPDFGYERYVRVGARRPDVLRRARRRLLPRAGRELPGVPRARAARASARRCGDFGRHLTTLFPEVRLKRVIEMRGADACSPG